MEETDNNEPKFHICIKKVDYLGREEFHDYELYKITFPKELPCPEEQNILMDVGTVWVRHHDEELGDK
jgi:hypothetical protein